MENDNYGLTPEQVKEVLELGLTPKQFELVRGNYGINSRTAKEHRAEVIEIFKRRKAQGKPIPTPCYDHPNTMDNDSATFFWIAIMLIAIIFKERWIIWIFATAVYMLHMTRHERKNQKEFDEFKKQEENK